MGRVVTGEELGRLLCDALDIPVKGIRTITLVCEPGSAASVRIERYVHEDDKLSLALDAYKITDTSRG